QEIVASSRVARGRPAGEAIPSGLTLAGHALGLNPRFGEALAIKGALLLARAREAKAGAERRAAAQDAADALSAAFREVPLLERRWGAALRAASELRRE